MNPHCLVSVHNGLEEEGTWNSHRLVTVHNGLKEEGRRFSVILPDEAAVGNHGGELVTEQPLKQRDQVALAGRPLELLELLVPVEVCLVQVCGLVQCCMEKGSGERIPKHCCK